MQRNAVSTRGDVLPERPIKDDSSLDILLQPLKSLIVRNIWLHLKIFKNYNIVRYAARVEILYAEYKHHIAICVCRDSRTTIASAHKRNPLL